MFHAVRNTHRMLTRHALTSRHPVDAYQRWARWQIASRLGRMPMIAPFVDETCIAIGIEHRGVRGNVYVGLLEFEDMSFAAHFLRQGDLFGDVGANIGLYSVIAAGVRQSHVIALEPVPITIQGLKRNIALNNLGHLVDVQEVGAGEKDERTYISIDEECCNHIVNFGEGLEISIRRLDDIFRERTPRLLKIDVEGFEGSVLKGAERLMSDPELRAIIVELNGLGSRYGYDDKNSDATIRKFGFKSYSYDPWLRRLCSSQMTGTANTIYIRDIDDAAHRVKEAEPIRVLNQLI